MEYFPLGSVLTYCPGEGDSPSLCSEEWSTTFVDFVSKCLVKDVEERWSVSELMEVSSLSEE